LRAFETLTNQVNEQLSAAYVEVAEGHAPAEPVLDRALASIEHLNEVAEAMMARLEELQKE